LATGPVGSQILHVRSIPTRTGCSEERVVVHDSTIRGFNRHTPMITYPGNPIPSVQAGSIEIGLTTPKGDAARLRPILSRERNRNDCVSSRPRRDMSALNHPNDDHQQHAGRTVQWLHDHSHPIGTVRIYAVWMLTTRERSSTSEPRSVLKTGRV